ncbi:MAG: TIGR03560 family F420-dependent LLM class oxidoreductase [Actinomycetota bacterium]|nr:TIGR03560 family F420-dependent LLM class oxidoreductase [Actinomycetota bacterium]
MVAISISVEGQAGLTWALWRRWVEMAETQGFAGLYRSDHFTMPAPPDEASLECIVSLAYLADHTSHVRFGPLVAPLSFRDPVMLARQAAALDDLSGGRMVLGVGTGWIEREHARFGYDLGDMQARFARLEEGLEVITNLLRSDEPVSYEGRFYRLREASLLPRPKREGGPEILIGGSGLERTPALAARFADVWNGTFMGPDVFRERSTALDALLTEQGRHPRDLRRTVAALCFFGPTDEVLARRVQPAREWEPELASLSLEAALETIRTEWGAVAGSPEVVVEQIQAYARAGVEELILQWFDVDDVDGAEAFARHVLPRL